MLFWVAVFAFGIPLLIFIRQTLKSKQKDENRLAAIQNRLAEIEQNKRHASIEAKKAKIASKHTSS